MTEKNVRVLIVDDSAFIRKVFREILSSHPSIDVVGTAHNGKEALEKVAELNPDVLLVDLYMPDMDGLQFLKTQMSLSPKPILLCSSAEEYDEKVLAAMEAGALEFIHKPTSRATFQIYSIENDLIEKVLAVANIPQNKLPQITAPEKDGMFSSKTATHTDRRISALVIGTSTGGPQALRYLLPLIPAGFPIPIAIVLHMPPGYTGPFAERLNDISSLEVLEASEGLKMKPGRAILAKAGYHLMLVKGEKHEVVCHLEQSIIHPTPHRPAVDVLFRTASTIYGSKLLALVLTGMGKDGTEGAAWVKAEGGLVYSESEETSIIFGMPGSIFEAGLSDKIVSLPEVIDSIMEIV